MTDSPAPRAAASSRLQADAERERLLAAAMQVLERSGWWGFKVESVLKEADLSTRSFYRHFGKKADLLVALLEEQMADNAGWLRQHTDSVTTPYAKVFAYVAALLDMGYLEDKRRPTSLFGSHWRELIPDYPEELERCIEFVIAPLAEAITEGTASGDFDCDDPVADARAIYFLVASVTADQATLCPATPRDEIEHMLLPFIDRMIGPH
ncbi:TetR/AcrR family transcriptional regulator [Mycobacterium sp. NBC_00419]|uniref:TetR/AcrR family transcriptional regulator n=1 Tax=Mycobacterium sp. NBC_00419 TaxID=2975989 RepID=UPI002E1EC4BE